MSVTDLIKKSVLDAFQSTQLDATKIAVGLVMALLIGIIIYCVYKTFYSGVIYSHNFAVTLVGMTVLSCMITLAISSNLVISMGMVGALSIVRFRTAIKDPMDLLYLFWAITSGITIGANLYSLVLITAVVITVTIIIFYFVKSSGKVYVLILHYKDYVTDEQIKEALGKRRYVIKSVTVRKEQTEMAIEVKATNKSTAFLEKLRNIDGITDVTMIQYNGEYHA